MVLATLAADIFCQSVRRYRVCNDGASRMLLQDYGRDERYERVAVYGFALTSDDGRAVNVGIENHAEVSIGGLHGIAYRSHSLSILRIGDMVGKVTVRLKKLAAFRIGSERTQNLLEEASVAVACVHDDVHAL